MAGIQSIGIGSGIDASSIIAQLLALERQPLSRLQKTASGVQSQISLYGNMRAKADAVGTSARDLAASSTWQATAVNLNGANEFTVSAAGTAAPTNLEVEITALAQRQSVSTRSFASPTTDVGTGILTIQRGSWSAGFGAFTAASGTAPIEIMIGTGQGSLAGIRDAINSAGAGVTATILNDGSGARLVIRSDDTGQDNGFSISTSAVTGDLGALSFAAQNLPASAAGAQGDTRGADLQAKVNGAAVTAPGNTLSNVLDGVSITATKLTTSPRTVTIERDLASMRGKIESFVSAYNDLIGFIRTQTAYNEATKTGAPLQGDRVALLVQSRVRGAALEPSGATSAFGRLSDVGIALQTDGSLRVDQTKLNRALGQLDDVAQLFTRDEEGTAQDGVAVRIGSLVKALTGTEGAIESKQTSLREVLRRNQQDQARMEDRIADVEKRLKARYTALDSQMGSLNSLGAYVARQFSTSNT